MIVVDTNVVSELFKTSPSPLVVKWFNRHAKQSFITAISRAEILLGIAIMPEGRRKRELEGAAAELLELSFRNRTLPFAREAADYYALIIESRKKAGKPISTCDAMIAAIARVTSATVATRNVRDFKGCGIGVIDPFASTGDANRVEEARNVYRLRSRYFPIQKDPKMAPRRSSDEYAPVISPSAC